MSPCAAGLTSGPWTAYVARYAAAALLLTVALVITRTVMLQGLDLAPELGNETISRLHVALDLEHDAPVTVTAVRL